MGSFLSFVAELMLTFVAVWLVIFGAIGALLSRARGGRPWTGCIWGAALGPIGWGAIWWRTRSGSRTDVQELVDRPQAFEPLTAAGVDEHESRGLRF